MLFPSQTIIPSLSWPTKETYLVDKTVRSLLLLQRRISEDPFPPLKFLFFRGFQRPLPIKMITQALATPASGTFSC